MPYLLGEGQAMMYSVYPRSKVYRKIPRLPLRPPDNYLRDNMVRTLAEQDVEFDIMLQVQTDPFRMPIEDAAVRWPERLSPFVPAARLHIPRQTFDSPAQLAFANNLSLNPWHCIAGASAARQPEPRAAADVLGAVAVPSEDEQQAAYRADR